MKKSEIPKEEVNSFSLEDVCQSSNNIKNLLEIVESHPSETAVQFGKSIIYFMLDDYDRMLNHLESLTESFPSIPLLHRRIAEVYVYKKNYLKAIRHLEKTLELDEKDLTAKILLNLIYFKAGKLNEADNCFQEIAELVFVLNVSERSFNGLQ